jgi:lipoyl(octanoyl) transferase
VTLAPVVRRLGRVDYTATVAAMRAFTEQRDEATPDQIWLCEHDPVYTQGVAGKQDHVLNPRGIPVVQTNRGGQVTYHGPGQVVAYPLVDLKRLGIFVKEYVFRIEQAVIKTLEGYGVTGHRVAGAPGIYVSLDNPFGHATLPSPPDPRDPWRGIGKIAALGIKLSRHRAYHGLALNVAMDMEPFSRIDPCGYVGLQTVDLARLGVLTDWNHAAAALERHLRSLLTP